MGSHIQLIRWWPKTSGEEKKPGTLEPGKGPLGNERMDGNSIISQLTGAKVSRTEKCATRKLARKLEFLLRKSSVEKKDVCFSEVVEFPCPLVSDRPFDSFGTGRRSRRRRARRGKVNYGPTIQMPRSRRLAGGRAGHERKVYGSVFNCVKRFKSFARIGVLENGKKSFLYPLVKFVLH